MSVEQGQLQFSLNRYTYAVNNPVMYWDPDGRWPGEVEYNAYLDAKEAETRARMLDARARQAHKEKLKQREKNELARESIRRNRANADITHAQNAADRQASSGRSQQVPSTTTTASREERMATASNRARARYEHLESARRAIRENRAFADREYERREDERRGGTIEELYSAGKLDEHQLYDLVPPPQRLDNFFLSTNQYSPKPYWSEEDVTNYYWQHSTEHGAGDSVPYDVALENGMQTWIDSQPPVEKHFHYEPRRKISIGKVLSIAAKTAEYATSFTASCIGTMAITQTVTAQATVVGSPVAGIVAAGTACLAGGLVGAGVPGVYDGMGPVGP